MCVAAREDGKTLVTALWVEHSADIGMPVDATSVCFFFPSFRSCFGRIETHFGSFMLIMHEFLEKWAHLFTSRI